MAWNKKYLHNLVPGPGNTAGIWGYRDTVASTALDLAGYIPDGGKRGMKIGDIVFYQQVDNQDTPTSITAVSMHYVKTVNAATGAVDLTDALVVTATNTD